MVIFMGRVTNTKLDSITDTSSHLHADQIGGELIRSVNVILINFEENITDKMQI